MYSNINDMFLTQPIQANIASVLPLTVVKNFHYNTSYIANPHTQWTWTSASQMAMGSQLHICANCEPSTHKMILAWASAILSHFDFLLSSIFKRIWYFDYFIFIFYNDCTHFVCLIFSSRFWLQLIKSTIQFSHYLIINLTKNFPQPLPHKLSFHSHGPLSVVDIVKYIKVGGFAIRYHGKQMHEELDFHLAVR
jgi:hypothetical protein